MRDIIRFIGVNKDSRTAGPGKRLEFFTKGCIRGVISPCKGCFNQSTWTFEGALREMTIDDVVDICVRDAWNRQVTFCGGEPILQARALAKVAKKLKEKDSTFHFVMYTAYKLDVLLKHGLKFMWVKEKHEYAMLPHLIDYSHSYRIKEIDDNRQPKKVSFTILTPEDVQELCCYIDLIVDGDFQIDKRLTTDKYMHDGWFIGSANQRVINGPSTYLKGRLDYIAAEDYNKFLQLNNKCKCCGHVLLFNEDFCNDVCEKRYHIREKEMTLFGGV